MYSITVAKEYIQKAATDLEAIKQSISPDTKAGYEEQLKNLSLQTSEQMTFNSILNQIEIAEKALSKGNLEGARSSYDDAHTRYSMAEFPEFKKPYLQQKLNSLFAK